MRLTALICIFTAAWLTTSLPAQTITGKIVNKRLKGIEGATVTLKVKGVSATSDASGAFAIGGVAVIAPKSSFSHHQTLFINGQNLLFTNDYPQQLKIELFNMNGKRVGAVFSRMFDEGSFSLPILSLINTRSAKGLFIARITKGSEMHTASVQPALRVQTRVTLRCFG